MSAPCNVKEPKEESPKMRMQPCPRAGSARRQSQWLLLEVEGRRGTMGHELSGRKKGEGKGKIEVFLFKGEYESSGSTMIQKEGAIPIPKA